MALAEVLSELKGKIGEETHVSEWLTVTNDDYGLANDALVRRIGIQLINC